MCLYVYVCVSLCVYVCLCMSACMSVYVFVYVCVTGIVCVLTFKCHTMHIQRSEVNFQVCFLSWQKLMGSKD